MSIFASTAFYNIQPVAIAAASSSFQVRNDAFSASLVTAQPFSIFSELGMNNYTQSLDGLIRTGNQANSYLMRSTASLASYLYASASVVSSGSAYLWADQGYTSSISHENSANAGVIRTATNNIAAQNFVCEFWFNPRQNFGDPPFHMWCFGSDAGGDNLLIQWSNSGTDLFRFYVNGNTTWTTTPNVPQGTGIVNGTWYHVAFVKSGTTVNVYLNGNRIGVGTRAATINTPASARYELVGIASGNNNDGLRANVQDYRVYIGTDKGYTGATITIPQSIVQKLTF
jgi:hypothetical protein